ncbi:hypothetical protein ACFL18_01155 [Patescibacteria group bacterium]
MPKKRLKKTKSSKSLEAKKILTGATLAGSLLLTSGSQPTKAITDKPPELRAPLGLITHQELKELLAKLLKKSLPDASRVLTDEEETELTKTIQQTLGIKAVAELDNNRLNHQVGMMGLEQHLMRYPGDKSLAGRNFPKAGIAPGKGAWGYWASSKATLTKADIEMEQYYLAVQTLYLPDWQARVRELRDWYKYRKVLVINPDNGAAVVAVIGDAGPAKWTGKVFGGSPAVMYDLGFYPKKHKGRTIVLFIDDPDNQVPLGPVTKHLKAPEPTST